MPSPSAIKKKEKADLARQAKAARDRSDRILSGARSILEGGFPAEERASLLVIWREALRGALLSGAGESEVRSLALKNLSRGLSKVFGSDSSPETASLWLDFFLEAVSDCSGELPPAATLLFCSQAPLPLFRALASRSPLADAEAQRVARSLFAGGDPERGSAVLAASASAPSLLESPSGRGPSYIGLAWRSLPPWREFQARLRQAPLSTFEQLSAFSGSWFSSQLWDFSSRSSGKGFASARRALLSAFPLSALPAGASPGEAAAAMHFLAEKADAPGALALFGKANPGALPTLPWDFSLALALAAPTAKIASLEMFLSRAEDDRLAEALGKILLARLADASSSAAREKAFSCAILLCQQALLAGADSSCSAEPADPRFERAAGILANPAYRLALRAGVSAKIDPSSETGRLLLALAALDLRSRASAGRPEDFREVAGKLLSGKTQIRKAWGAAAEGLALSLAAPSAPEPSAAKPRRSL